MTERPRIEVARFPRNAACAVTSSWDDNEPRDIDLCKILDSVGLKGTFYVDLNAPRDNGLGDGQLRTIAATQELGSHTLSHANLKRTAKEKLRQELQESKVQLERITEQPVYGIAYPWGEHSLPARETARACGYLFGRTVDEGNIAFPPTDPFRWGISVHALPRPRLMSRKSYIYVRNLTGDWYKLALRLFSRALRTHGVWHVFGHAWEIFDRPGLKDDFLKICQQVGGRDDVWYTTNGMLFLNERSKEHLLVTEKYANRKATYEIQSSASEAELRKEIPLSFRILVPDEWKDETTIAVFTPQTGSYQTKRLLREIQIDVYDAAAKIEISAN